MDLPTDHRPDFPYIRPIYALMLHLQRIPHILPPMILNTIGAKTVKRLLLQICAVFLLLLYIAGSAPLDILHSFAHRHEVSVEHSDEQESDPCHRSIYHNDQQGCTHETHVVQSDKCHMCDIAFHADETLLNAIPSVCKIYEAEGFTSYRSRFNSHQEIFLPSRAPPVANR